MNIEEPTREQIKEFWEWCGFTLRCPPEKDAYGRGIWNYPEGTYGDLELDLNNLFKYAVPKLESSSLRIVFSLGMEVNDASLFWHVQIGEFWQSNKDPALALFWAIWEVIK